MTEKKDGRGGRVAKGLTLIAAAGLVALVRNVVKAYLGRGMLCFLSPSHRAHHSERFA